MNGIQNLLKNIKIGDSILVELNKEIIDYGFVYFLGDLPIKKIECDGHWFECYQESLVITKDRIHLTIITLNDEKKILSSNDGNFKSCQEKYIIKDTDSFFIKPSIIFLNELCF